MSFKKLLALVAAGVDFVSLVMDWIRAVYKLPSADRVEYLLAFKGRAAAFLDSEFDKGGLTPPDRRTMKPERTQ